MGECLWKLWREGHDNYRFQSWGAGQMRLVQGGPKSSYLGSCDSSPGCNIHGFKACREEVFREADAGQTAEEVDGAGRTLVLRVRQRQPMPVP